MKTNLNVLLIMGMLTFGLLGGPAAQATVLNPSFENGCFDNWGESGPSFGADVLGVGGCGGSLSLNGFPTDGNKFGRIYSGSNTTISQGAFGSVFQQVDLTSIGSIMFDASLERFASGGEQNSWDSNYEAGFFIDGSAVWTASTFAAGNYLDRSIDTSALTGLHNIAFRNTRTGATGFSDGSNWFMFDNLRTVPADDGVTVPEPASIGILAFSLGGLVFMRRRRFKV